MFVARPWDASTRRSRLKIRSRRYLESSSSTVSSKKNSVKTKKMEEKVAAVKRELEVKGGFEPP